MLTSPVPNGTIEMLLTASRFAWGVKVAAPGFLPDDAHFGIEQGVKRRLMMIPDHPGDARPTRW
jgi:hypothetical protein